jgi:hypothetical protein
MAKMSKEVMDVFNDPGSAKVLATAGSTVLEINAVPKGSLRAIGEDIIAFADIFGKRCILQPQIENADTLHRYHARYAKGLDLFV